MQDTMFLNIAAMGQKDGFIVAAQDRALQMTRLHPA